MNSLIEKGIVRFRNQISKGGEIFLNVHCAGNMISLKGEKSSLLFDGESYSRNSSFNIEGSNNKVMIGNRSIISGNCNIRIIGNNNTVRIAENCSIISSSVYISGDNNNIVFEEEISAVLTSVQIERDNNTLFIGHKSTIHGRSDSVTEFILDEGTSITVKKDCMVSAGVSVRSSDNHSVLNVKGERINPAGNIEIGNHVWIGMRTMILKNTVIHDNCVIGAGSLCNKEYKEENCLIAGNPAKIVKKNVNWSRERL